MSEMLLSRALCRWLEDQLKGFRLTDTAGTERPVNVIDGWLPPKRGSNGEDWPFVAVRPIAGNIDDGRADCTVQIVVGVLTDGSYGEHGRLLNVVRRVLNALAGLPDAMLDNRFQLESPVGWKVEEEQPYPAWMATITTIWDFASVEAPHGLEARTYGYFE